MIIGDRTLAQRVESGPSTIGKDGVIQQGKPSGPPHEGSRETYEGKIISVPRDYCWTPIGSGKILIGYKIWAWQREATNLADSVTQTSLRSHVKDSYIKHCYGDEKGKLGGFTSHTHNSWCTPKTWSKTVTFEGRNAVRDSDEWWMNHRNTWGVLDYKKNMDQSPSEDPKTIDPKLYLASATAVAPAAGAFEGRSAGQAVSTAGSYIARGLGFLAEGGMAVTGALAGGILVASTGSTAGPEQDQPFPHGIPPSTPAPPQPASPPPSTPTAQQPASPPPTVPEENLPTSPPPSTPVEQPPTSPPPSTPAEDIGPQISETLPPAKGGTPQDTERTKKAKEVGEKLKDEDVLVTNRNGVRISKKYRRPRFRKSTRDEVARRHTKDGKLYDGNGNEISSDKSWDVGRDQGYEFWKQQESAQARGLTHEQFLEEYNDPAHLSPELSGPNQGHAGEDKTNTYLGPE